jgi:hypothetical protein
MKAIVVEELANFRGGRSAGGAWRVGDPEPSR